MVVIDKALADALRRYEAVSRGSIADDCWRN
jgi:hypothetical protein